MAKLANHVAKTADRKPGSYPRELAHVCDFGNMTAEQLETVMGATEVGEVWGIRLAVRQRVARGRRRLRRRGCHGTPLCVREIQLAQP